MTDENGRRAWAETGREDGNGAGGLPLLPDGAEKSLTEAGPVPQGYGDVPGGGETGRRRVRLGESARNALICAVSALCLAALLIPAVVTGVRADAAGTGGAFSRALCRIMITSALPPTDRPLWARWIGEETDGTRTAGEDTAAPEAAGEAGSSAAETRPQDSDPVVSGQETVGPEVETDETTPGAPDDPELDTGGETDGAETVSENDPSAPVPARPVIVSRDVSESEGGARRMRNDTDFDPSGLTPGWDPAGTAVRPVVLVTSSHPFEAYADGGTTGEQAAALADALRARGLTVVLIGPSASGITAETSFAHAYERTRALVQNHCLLYADTLPVIVIDVRRSAELTEAGGADAAPGTSGLLRTVGAWNGQPAAQLRLIVDAYRGGTGADAAKAGTAPADWRFAQAVRDRLFALSPTVSRPVWIRAGTGLLPTDPAGPVAGRTPPLLLTAEFGAAGNTSGEADPLVGLLARTVAELLK